MNELTLKEDINKIAELNIGDLNIVIAQMTILVNALVSDRDDIEDTIKLLEKQLWYKRMWDTPIGKIKVTKEDFSQKKDKMIVYMIQAISSLYEMGKIDQDILISLGEKFKEIYYWVMRDSFEQLVIEDSVIQIRNMVGSIAAKLNDKIERMDNFQILIKQINQNVYKNDHCCSELISICRIVAHIDNRTLEDPIKLGNIRECMKEAGFISGYYDLLRYMDVIAYMPQDKIGEVYLGLSLISSNFLSVLFTGVMEKYSMLPYAECMAKNKDYIIKQIMYNNDMYSCVDIGDIFQAFQDDHCGYEYVNIDLCDLFDSFIESRKETAEVTSKIRFDK